MKIYSREEIIEIIEQYEDDAIQNYDPEGRPMWKIFARVLELLKESPPPSPSTSNEEMQGEVDFDSHQVDPRIAEIVDRVQWYAKNGTPDERNHFYAVELVDDIEKLMANRESPTCGTAPSEVEEIREYLDLRDQWVRDGSAVNQKRLDELYGKWGPIDMSRTLLGYIDKMQLNSSEPAGLTLMPRDETVSSAKLQEKLWSAYSWIVDAKLPMQPHGAMILLEAKDCIQELEKELEEWKQINRNRADEMLNLTIASSLLKAQNAELLQKLKDVENARSV